MTPPDATATRTTIPVQMATGSYTGNATDNRAINGLPFQPDVVIVKASSASQIAVVRTSSMPAAGNNTKPMTGGNVLEVGVKTLTSDGFTLGVGARVNANGTTYHWMAFKASAGVLNVGTYTGSNAISNPRSITGVGFQPEYVAVLPATNANPFQRFAGMSQGFLFQSGGGNNNRITALNSDGFTVGSRAM